MKRKNDTATPSSALPWPIRPYPGLNYYGSEDALIFAGREAAILRCAARLAAPGNIVLLLHGSTGCGKTSFLRAGLIPCLENPAHGYGFVKAAPPRGPVVFIRSTARPLVQIAEAIYDFCGSEVTVNGLNGPRRIDLASAVAEFDDKPSFVRAVLEESFVAVKALSALAERLVNTLVLVIDQAEEVFTIEPGTEGDINRSEFFDFVSKMIGSAQDVNVIVSLRTEYFGKFHESAMEIAGPVGAIGSFLLKDMTEDELVEAIIRPASDKDENGLGSPGAHYGFEYEKGVPRKIAKELLTRLPPGGVLPALQIICSRLYFEAVENRGEHQRAKVTSGMFDDAADVNRLLERHILEHLYRAFVEQDLPKKYWIEEEMLWKRVLMELSSTQIDGTVTTGIVRKDDLRELTRKIGCRIDFDKALHTLSSPAVRVLRILNVFDLPRNRDVECCTLGHDAVGLVATGWSGEISDSIRRRRLFGFRRLCLVGASVSAITSAAAVLLWLFSSDKTAGIVALVAGMYAMALLATSFWVEFVLATVQRWLRPIEAALSIDEFRDLPTEERVRSKQNAEIGAVERLRPTREDVASNERKLAEDKLRVQLIDAAHPMVTTWPQTVNEARQMIAGGTQSIGIWIHLARALRWHVEDLSEAIAVLDDAISRFDRADSQPSKGLSVAYYNRACYHALSYGRSDDPDQLRQAVSDVMSCLALVEDRDVEIAEIMADPDFDAIRNTEAFRQAMEMHEAATGFNAG